MLGFVVLGHFNLFKLMLVLFHVTHNFSIWHLRNLATLEPKISTSQAPKSNSLRTVVMIQSKVSFPPPITSSTCTPSTPWIFPLF